MKWLLPEVEVTTPSNQMDLHQDIQVINQKRQEFLSRGEAQMEDARTPTSLKRLASTFENLLESPEADKTAITVVKDESFPTGNSGDITVSAQELVYGGKEAGVGTSPKPLDRSHELLSSSKEALGPRKNTGSSEELETPCLAKENSKR
ncbi:hypothetical protein O181_123062 [Austropuccinia psidii MF-1]|uniref:Uncharacterized protein n=1 Tax=Austropuccinia psidii MF-1 TaxID=1389203 RepID=A0A9Q3KM05_9BASI|nr:hypothetical protein [Austropuccinia psidii MF-1]